MTKSLPYTGARRDDPQPWSRNPRRVVAAFGAALALGLQACSGGAGITEPPPPPDSSSADTTIIQVDATSTFQTLDGFGGTTPLLVYNGEDWLGPYRDDAVRAVFDDVGISLALIQIGLVETPANAAEPWTDRQNDNADPFVMAPAGFNWDGSDEARQRVVLPARQYGFADLTLDASLNLKGPLTWLETIRSQDYQRYLDEAAEHVLAIVEHWTETYGLRPKRVFPFSEPTTGFRSLLTTSIPEMVDLVKTIGQRLDEAGYGDVKLVVPNEETITRSIQVARAILQDPTARRYVGVIGYHPYPYGSTYASVDRILATSGAGSPDATTVAQLEELRALGQEYDVPVWLTEVTQGPGMNDYPYGAMENLLARAIHIHDNFEYAGAAGFFGMNVWWDSRSHEAHFDGRNVPFLSAVDHMILVDVDQGEVLITGMGRAVGHFARWLAPGAVRIATTSDNSRVIVSGFDDLLNRRQVLVVVNNTDQERLLRIRLQGAQASGTVTGEASWGEERWKAIPTAQPLSGDEVQVTVAARSVTTIAVPTG